MDDKRFACPCCGYFTFPKPSREAVGFICPVCFWENDVFQPDEHGPSDCNHGMTLIEGRSNFKKFGACESAMKKHVRPPKREEISPESGKIFKDHQI